MASAPAPRNRCRRFMTSSSGVTRCSGISQAWGSLMSISYLLGQPASVPKAPAWPHHGRSDQCSGEKYSPGDNRHQARGAGDDFSGRNQLFQQYENRKSRHPEQVHHAPHEEQNQQRPAAADAVESVFGALLKSAGRIASEGTGPLQESERRLTLRKAGILERQPLPNSGNEKKGTGDDGVVERHHGRDERDLRQASLRDTRNNCKCSPHREVTGGEPAGGGKDGALPPRL